MLTGRFWHFLLLVPILLAPALIVATYYIGISDFSILAHIRLGLFSEAVKNSFFHLLFTLVLTCLLAIPLAWLTAICKFHGSDILQWALLVPLALPTFSLALIYEQTGFFTQLWFPLRMAIYSSLSLYPLVYLIMRLAFVSLNAEYLDASRCLGWGIFPSMLRMGISMNRPALIAALTLIAMEVISDIATAQLLGFQSIAHSIYDASTGSGFSSLALELTCVLVIFFLVVLWLENVTRGRKRYHQIISGFRRAQTVELGNYRSLAAFALCMAVIFFAVLLPLFLLVGVSPLVEQTPLRVLLLPAFISLCVAGLTACVVLVFASLVSFALRYSFSRVLLLVYWLSGLTLVIPGSILAFLVIAPIERADAVLEILFNALSLPIESPLRSSYIPLIYVLVLKFLAIGSFVIRATILATSETMDMASRSLGHTTFATFFKIHLPLLIPTLCAVFFLVFSETIQESAITLLLTPDSYFSLVSYAITNIATDGLAATNRELILITALALIPALIITTLINLKKV